VNAVRYLAALALCTGLMFNVAHSGDKKPTAAKTEPSTDLKDHEPLAALIAKADKTVLYEGLPHQMWEKDVLAKEKKEKKTIDFNGFPFYAEPIEVKDADRKECTKLLSDPASLKEFVANKRCGGFHPDWCLEWRTGEEVVRCQVCFGCRQVKFYNAKTILFADLTDAAIEQIEPALMKYQKQRPAHLRGQ
jgi:hypothetical protein